MIVKFDDALLKHLKQGLSLDVEMSLPKGRASPGFLTIHIRYKGHVVTSSGCPIYAPKAH